MIIEYPKEIYRSSRRVILFVNTMMEETREEYVSF